MGATEDEMGVPWTEAASMESGGGDLWIPGSGEAAASSKRDGEGDLWISGREAESSKRKGDSDPWISEAAASSDGTGADGGGEDGMKISGTATAESSKHMGGSGLRIRWVGCHSFCIESVLPYIFFT
ncbi:hypothetical protein FKM82_028122 [Ascaphus truei]